jgi:nitrogen-specific signal transduction histidine kinase
VQKIIRIHDGTIEVSSSSEGTVFTVTLPQM